MKKTILLSTLMIFLVLLLFGCAPKCPETCDDGNKCTIDYCSNETNYICNHNVVKPCNGNIVCEIGEYGNSSDCPNCDDNNAFTKDYYDIEVNKCTNEKLNSKEKAESVAEKFARNIEQQNYGELWGLFIPELKKIKSKKEFVDIMSYEDSFKLINSMRLEHVSVENETVAYAYFDGSGGMFTTQFSAIKMEFINGTWKFDAFASIFEKNIKDVKIRNFLKTIAESQKEQTGLLLDFGNNVKSITTYLSIYQSPPQSIWNNLENIYASEEILNNKLLIELELCPDNFDEFCNNLKHEYSDIGISFQLFKQGKTVESTEYMDKSGDARIKKNQFLFEYNEEYWEYYKSIYNS